MDALRYLPIWLSAVLGGSLLAFVLATTLEDDSSPVPSPAVQDETIDDEGDPDLAAADEATDEAVEESPDAAVTGVTADSLLPDGVLDTQDLISGRISDRLRELTDRP